MVPGKKYGPDDLLEIAWRRKWFILIPFVLGTAGTVAYSASLPSLYTSEALILVIPQQVPRNYVASTVTTQIDQRLQAISQQVLSRSRLEQLIHEFNLYPEQRQTGLMEDVVVRMRDVDIQVAIAPTSRNAKATQGGTSLRVGFTYTDPGTAMRVAERLASLFIDANLRDRELLAEGTDQFIEAEMRAAEKRLADMEKAIADYRSRYPWDQAEQVEHNRWVMVNTQQALEKRGFELAQARERLLFMEKVVADLTNAVPEQQGTPDAVPRTAAAQLEAAKGSLRALELRLTPEHPDVIQAKRVIDELTRKAEQEALAAPVSADAATPPAMDPGDRDRLFNMRAEIVTVKGRIAQLEARERELQTLLAQQEQRVRNSPTRALEMQALMRDYDVVKSHYHDLLRKKEAAQIAANLERQQVGEQMRLVDAPRAPHRPTSPDRARINLLGAALTLGFGLGLAALLELRDTSLRTEVDVVSALALPVLALVPVMKGTREHRRTRRRWLTWSTTGVLAILVPSAAALWALWS